MKAPASLCTVDWSQLSNALKAGDLTTHKAGSSLRQRCLPLPEMCRLPPSIPHVGLLFSLQPCRIKPRLHSTPSQLSKNSDGAKLVLVQSMVLSAGSLVGKERGPSPPPQFVLGKPAAGWRDPGKKAKVALKWRRLL